MKRTAIPSALEGGSPEPSLSVRTWISPYRSGAVPDLHQLPDELDSNLFDSSSDLSTPRGGCQARVRFCSLPQLAHHVDHRAVTPLHHADDAVLIADGIHGAGQSFCAGDQLLDRNERDVFCRLARV